MSGSHPLGLAPSKIVAVHVNYRGRAAQRGVLPTAPSYFLKPPSSLSCTGTPVIRPRGCELLVCEGEIALVMGRSAHRVSPEEALGHVRGYAAAGDFGVYDFRHADRGSNLRAKGQDGFTPVGPVLLEARDVDPVRLRLRTWVNGEPIQDATTEELIFPFGYLIADLSRLMTLNVGDIILTGTPAGAATVRPGDVVEIEVGEAGRLRTEIREADHDLPRIGAMPKVGTADRVAAGEPTLDERTRNLLAEVSTATLSSCLRRHGVPSHVIDGVRPTRPDLRMVGTAHTLRYAPLREDVFAERGTGMNAQKRAVESIGPGQVLVIEARGDTTAGTIGDILALRAARRGAAGIVTDGGLRDSPSFAGLDLPTYFAAASPAVLGRRHVPLDVGTPVACGNTLVMPGDVLVGDAEGVVVVPAAMAAEIAAEAMEQEREERFIYRRVSEGAAIEGLYPMDARRRAEYEAWRDGQ
jgi:5-oxopent-3-ene-1,2,5-tricarboxylate decarboxylase / 2-hydroxyhepta-2,4-diene-1,7-dioate isomerase